MKKHIIVTTNEENPELSDVVLTVSFPQYGITEDRLKDWLRTHRDAEIEYLNDKWPEEPIAAVGGSKPLPARNSITTKYEIRE